MNIPGLTTAHKVEAPILPRQLVKHGSVPDEILPASDGSALIIGVSTLIGSDTGDTADVIRSQLALVIYGDAITAGQPLTSDVKGRAVPAGPGDFYLGFAEYDGAEGDVGSVWIVPGKIPA